MREEIRILESYVPISWNCIRSIHRIIALFFITRGFTGAQQSRTTRVVVYNDNIHWKIQAIGNLNL